MADGHNRTRSGGPSHPIPVWNGIFDHRQGSAIWVFLWCIDRVTKEESGAGLVLGGCVVTALRIAQELADSERTIRRNLRRLAGYGYISLKLAAYGFVITVTNSRKFGIWRSDKSVRPDAGYADLTPGVTNKNCPTSGTKVSDLGDKSVRRNKEDSAVDSAVTQQGNTKASLCDVSSFSNSSNLSSYQQKGRPILREGQILLLRELADELGLPAPESGDIAISAQFFAQHPELDDADEINNIVDEVLNYRDCVSIGDLFSAALGYLNELDNRQGRAPAAAKAPARSAADPDCSRCGGTGLRASYARPGVQVRCECLDRPQSHLADEEDRQPQYDASRLNETRSPTLRRLESR